MFQQSTRCIHHTSRPRQQNIVDWQRVNSPSDRQDGWGGGQTYTVLHPQSVAGHGFADALSSADQIAKLCTYSLAPASARSRSSNVIAGAEGSAPPSGGTFCNFARRLSRKASESTNCSSCGVALLEAAIALGRMPAIIDACRGLGFDDKNANATMIATRSMAVGADALCPSRQSVPY